MSTINLKPINEDVVTVSCDMDESIENIILRYGDKTERYINWRVIYKGKQLEKSRTLMDYDIWKGETLTLIRSMSPPKLREGHIDKCYYCAD